MYFKVRIEHPTANVDEKLVKTLLLECMKRMFGNVGAESWRFDVVGMAKDQVAVLRVERKYVSVRCR